MSDIEPEAPTSRESSDTSLHIAKLFLGLVSFCVLIGVTTMVVGLSNSAWPGAISLLFWIGFDVYVWRSLRHWRGIVIGQLIGLGLLLLVAGLCFAAISSGRIHG